MATNPPGAMLFNIRPYSRSDFRKISSASLAIFSFNLLSHLTCWAGHAAKRPCVIFEMKWKHEKHIEEFRLHSLRSLPAFMGCPWFPRRSTTTHIKEPGMRRYFDWTMTQIRWQHVYISDGYMIKVVSKVSTSFSGRQLTCWIGAHFGRQSVEIVGLWKLLVTGCWLWLESFCSCTQKIYFSIYWGSSFTPFFARVSSCWSLQKKFCKVVSSSMLQKPYHGDTNILEIIC